MKSVWDSQLAIIKAEETSAKFYVDANADTGGKGNNLNRQPFNPNRNTTQPLLTGAIIASVDVKTTITAK